jgi:hypothetical protein
MGWTIGLLVGLSLLALATFLAVREYIWLRSARVTHGTIIELIPSRGSKGGTNYKPRVQFTAADGSQHEFTRSYSSRPAGFTVGERVAVAYDARSFEGRILTFGQRFGIPVIVGSIGLGLTVMALCFTAGRALVPRIFLPARPAVETPATQNR